MREIIIYTIVGLSSLLIMGFVVHMMVGGLVSPETETMLIVLVCLIDLAVIGYMAWDVIQHRKKKL